MANSIRNNSESNGTGSEFQWTLTDACGFQCVLMNGRQWILISMDSALSWTHTKHIVFGGNFNQQICRVIVSFGMLDTLWLLEIQETAQTL